jgi:hypothetical protein
MAQLGRAATYNDVLVSVHGRRLGIVGDGQAGDPSALVLDGSVIASNRLTTPFIAASSLGSNGAGGITIAGTQPGDTVVSALNLTDTGGGPGPTNANSSFEPTVTVAGQVQQTSTSNLSGSWFLFIVWPRS